MKSIEGMPPELEETARVMLLSVYILGRGRDGVSVPTECVRALARVLTLQEALDLARRVRDARDLGVDQTMVHAGDELRKRGLV